jgi:diaminohydroxyphosphoribosylaminopyrimidine deaminase / 5-amino-6-(5-phosphoribosylamino)uracil reductase
MEKFMKIALKLAAEYRGFTSPNPMVGAIVVKGGKIIGSGAHQKAGEPHAEALALAKAGKNAENATLFVTLEPCSHYGKTPPCVEKIIEAGISRVVSAMEDPNPLVNGKGYQILRDSGIEIITGVCEKEAQILNEIFIKNITQNKPFIILKAAISLDGKIATNCGDSKWLSNEMSRHEVHKIRNSVNAILIGENTFLQDNPRLTVRFGKSSNPTKIILSEKLNFTFEKLQSSNIFQAEKPVILCVPQNNLTKNKLAEFNDEKVKIIAFDNLTNLLSKLKKTGINSILLEGGSGVYTSFLQENLVDKLHIFVTEKIIGNSGISWVNNLNIPSVKDAIQLKNMAFKQFDNNILISGYLRK